MKAWPRQFAPILAAAIGLLGLQCAALAQEWPTRPVTLIVTFAPGGNNDTVARILAARMGDYLGATIVVENVAGASGLTGAARVAKATADGYQVLLGDNGLFGIAPNMYRTLPYAVSDFAPVGLLVEVPLVLATRKDFPAGSLDEFIAYTKANQAKLQYGSPGAGTVPHLACVILNTVMGVNVTHIPYRGGAPAIQDLIAGRIDYQCPIMPTVAPQLEGGRVKALATLTGRRSSLLPDLPTAQERGLDVDISVWLAFVVPKGTPPAIVRKLHDAAGMAMDTPAVLARLHEVGADPVSAERRSPDYLQTLIGSEIQKWSAPIKASGVSIE
jgi:tripartite-type tricarboxylate transporter receptor subunit TctC